LLHKSEKEGSREEKGKDRLEAQRTRKRVAITPKKREESRSAAEMVREGNFPLPRKTSGGGRAGNSAKLTIQKTFLPD